MINYTIVSNSLPVNKDSKGTGMTFDIPSRTAAICSSNSCNLKISNKILNEIRRLSSV